MFEKKLNNRLFSTSQIQWEKLDLAFPARTENPGRNKTSDILKQAYKM